MSHVKFATISAILLLLNTSVAHANAADDLAAALGIKMTEESTQTFSAPTSTAATTTVTTQASTSTEAAQIETLKKLIVVLTQQLAALLEAKKNAVVTTTPSGFKEICGLNRDLRRGSKGKDVEVLQKFLVSEGLLDAGSVVSTFGARTEKAVQDWQKKYGVIGHGTPSTTGFGYVGLKTRALMQQECSQISAGMVDPMDPRNSNVIEGDKPQKVRLLLQVQGSSFKRGDKIPVVVTVLDPVPYTGTNIEFMQVTSSGMNTFGSQVYLPVGFTGEITHYLNASHMDPDRDNNSVTSIPLRALIEGRFYDTELKDNITRTIGMSDPAMVTILPDTSSGRLVFFLNGALAEENKDLQNSQFAGVFVATTTSRSNSIEYCDLFAETVVHADSFSCQWNGEEISEPVRNKKKTIAPSQQQSLSALGSYFMYWDDVIHATIFPIAKSDALQNCARNHSGNPAVSMRCVWNNEVIYDKGPLGPNTGPSDVEPGASPYPFSSP